MTQPLTKSPPDRLCSHWNILIRTGNKSILAQLDQDWGDAAQWWIRTTESLARTTTLKFAGRTCRSWQERWSSFQNSDWFLLQIVEIVHVEKEHVKKLPSEFSVTRISDEEFGGIDFITVQRFPLLETAVGQSCSRLLCHHRLSKNRKLLESRAGCGW